MSFTVVFSLRVNRTKTSLVVVHQIFTHLCFRFWNTPFLSKCGRPEKETQSRPLISLHIHCFFSIDPSSSWRWIHFVRRRWGLVAWASPLRSITRSFYSSRHKSFLPLPNMIRSGIHSSWPFCTAPFFSWPLLSMNSATRGWTSDLVRA